LTLLRSPFPLRPVPYPSLPDSWVAIRVATALAAQPIKDAAMGTFILIIVILAALVLAVLLVLRHYSPA